MSKHTPGPWRVFVDNREDRDGLIYVAGYNIESATTEVVGIEGIAAQDNAEANARLIAAAPDLLEACKVASALLKGLPRSMGYDFDARQLDAAIAKATGETP